jgi:hypothetical protein
VRNRDRALGHAQILGVAPVMPITSRSTRCITNRHDRTGSPACVCTGALAGHPTLGGAFATMTIVNSVLDRALGQ